MNNPWWWEIEQNKRHFDLATDYIRSKNPLKIRLTFFSELSCVCNSAKSLTKYEFDSILQRPICDPICEKSKTSNCVFPPPTPPPNSTAATTTCRMRQMNYTIYSPNRVNVEIYQSAWCTCDPGSHVVYEDFCIPQKLLHEYQVYQTFKPALSAPATPAPYTDLKYLMLFCQLIKNQTACQHLANLCVLSFYNLAHNSPCNHFYTSQTAELSYGGGSGDKTRPFLFYKKGKSVAETLDKVLDFQYDISGRNNLVSNGRSVLFNLLSCHKGKLSKSERKLILKRIILQEIFISGSQLKIKLSVLVSKFCHAISCRLQKIWLKRSHAEL